MLDLAYLVNVLIGLVGKTQEPASFPVGIMPLCWQCREAQACEGERAFLRFDA